MYDYYIDITYITQNMKIHIFLGLKSVRMIFEDLGLHLALLGIPKVTSSIPLNQLLFIRQMH